MRLVGVISTTVLSLALGAAALAFAQEQQERKEEPKSKPAAQEEKKAQPEKSAKQTEKPSAQRQKTAKPEEKNAQQRDKNTKQEEKSAQQHSPQAKPEEQTQRASHNGGGRIPDDRFRANFGREHSFHVNEADYRGHRFQYGGYWFGFVDSWPSNWLYTQDVFVVEINGVYYLCNATYPGVNVALSFEL